MPGHVDQVINLAQLYRQMPAELVSATDRKREIFDVGIRLRALIAVFRIPWEATLQTRLRGHARKERF